MPKYARQEADGTLVLDETLRRKITPQPMNFYRDSLESIPEGLDLIFFRNTLLYAQETQRNVIIDRIIRKLRPGGFLFLSSTEVPFITHGELELVSRDKVYFLQKRNRTNTPGVSVAKPQQATKVPEKDSEAPAPVVPPVVPTVSSEEILALLSAIVPRGQSGAEGSGLAVAPELQRAPREAQAPGQVPVQQSQAPETAPSAPALHRATSRPSPGETATRLVVECLHTLNASQLDRAAVLADELWAVAGHTSVAGYCRGWVYYTSGNPDLAREVFTLTLEKDGDFWPARYYRALLDIDQNPKGSAENRRVIRELGQCIETIDRHGDRGLEPFTYLLDGFHSTYFRRMAQRWIEKLEEKGRNPWP